MAEDLYSVFNSEAVECRPWCGCGDPICDDALFWIQEYYPHPEGMSCINCDMSYSWRRWETAEAQNNAT